jgi:hypothetical protein
VINVIKEYYAEGSNNQCYFTQLKSHTSPNNTGHYSGCGATAWMNLIGWHNLNFTPTLLNGKPRSNNDYTNELTMQLHNYLGTIGVPFTQDGLTWPWFMKKGEKFTKEILSHTASGYNYRVISLTGPLFGYRDGNWVFEIVKDYIINKKKPVIVGYFKDTHYAIGYGIIENTNESEGVTTYHLKANRGWGPEGYVENETLISSKDIFSCYGVDEFLPL